MKINIHLITEAELKAILERAQRGEDIGKRKSRPETLDEYFRRRSELQEQVRVALRAARGE